MSAPFAPRLFEASDLPVDQSPPFQSQAVTVSQVFSWYHDNNVGEGASDQARKEQRRVRALLTSWIVAGSAYGDRPVSQCKRFELLNFINAFAGAHGKQAAYTKRRWNATIQAPFNAAEKLDLIPKNPFRGLTYPEGEGGRDWTDAEYRVVRKLAAVPMRWVIVWMRYSGMRPGEVKDLEWSHVDDNVIVLRKHKTARKTRKPRRIPINRFMRRMLLLLKARNPKGTKHVFLNSKGTQWKIRALDKNLFALRRKAGLPDDLKLHGGRHTFVTSALESGLDIATVAQLVGHEGVATTQRYTHLANKVDHLIGAMEQAGKPVRKPRRPVPKSEEELPLFRGLE